MTTTRTAERRIRMRSVARAIMHKGWRWGAGFGRGQHLISPHGLRFAVARLDRGFVVLRQVHVRSFVDLSHPDRDAD